MNFRRAAQFLPLTQDVLARMEHRGYLVCVDRHAAACYLAGLMTMLEEEIEEKVRKQGGGK